MKSTWTDILKRLGFIFTPPEIIDLNNKYNPNKSIFVMTEQKIPLSFQNKLPTLPEHLQWQVMEIDEVEGTMTVSYVREL